MRKDEKDGKISLKNKTKDGAPQRSVFYNGRK